MHNDKVAANSQQIFPTKANDNIVENKNIYSVQYVERTTLITLIVNKLLTLSSISHFIHYSKLWSHQNTD